MTNKESRLVDYKKAAKDLDCSYWTVRRLVASGQIPFVKVGRMKKIDRRDLEQFIQEQKEVFV